MEGHMKIKMLVDAVTKIEIEPYRLIEQKTFDLHYDGIMDNDRQYVYYFLMEKPVVDEGYHLDQLDPYQYVEVKSVELDSKTGHSYVLYKLIALNKYQIDEILDNLTIIVEQNSPYKLIDKNITIPRLEPEEYYNVTKLLSYNPEITWID
jgi:hypothetical protein